MVHNSWSAQQWCSVKPFQVFCEKINYSIKNHCKIKINSSHTSRQKWDYFGVKCPFSHCPVDLKRLATPDLMLLFYPTKKCQGLVLLDFKKFEKHCFRAIICRLEKACAFKTERFFEYSFKFRCTVIYVTLTKDATNFGHFFNSICIL